MTLDEILSHDRAAPWWLRSPHLQTVWARLVRSRRLMTFDREVLPTPDGDELMLDHGAGPAGSPRVLLLHGLEGSAHSLHTQGLAVLVARAGWRSVVLNFRSCARDPLDITRRLPNRRPRLYHSGDTEDLDFVVRLLKAREPDVPIHAVGFSLGGNVLLKWLGEAGDASAIRGAATLSVPYDLGAAARFLERRVGLIYVGHFMTRLKNKAADLVARFPDETRHIDLPRVLAARTFREFDELLTAPLHGFTSAEDYYTRASALPYLGRIRIPTLCISSGDDPLIPAASVEAARREASPSVQIRCPRWGGHAGFVAGRWPWRPIYWAEEACLAWLRQVEDQELARLRGDDVQRI